MFFFLPLLLIICNQFYVDRTLSLDFEEEKKIVLFSILIPRVVCGWIVYTFPTKCNVVNVLEANENYDNIHIVICITMLDINY